MTFYNINFKGNIYYNVLMQHGKISQLQMESIGFYINVSGAINPSFRISKENI